MAQEVQMIKFTKFWIKRIKEGNASLIVPSQHDQISYIKETGWKPDYSFLSKASTKDKKRYLSTIRNK